MSEEEKKRLNQLGQSILKKNGFDLEEHQDYDWIRSMGGQGYAHHYLAYSKKNSKMNEVDASIYRQLIDIDSKLGTNDHRARELQDRSSNLIISETGA